jgi:transposase
MNDEIKKCRKRYDDLFKQQAVKILVESGKPVTTVADQLGIEQSNLHKWNKQFGEEVRQNLHNASLEYKSDEFRSLKAEIASIRDTVETLRLVVFKILNQKYQS